MEHTDTLETGALQAIKRRVELPLLLFSGSVFCLLLLSYLFVLPRFTGFPGPNGEVLSPRQLRQYERSLTASISSKEKNRTRLIVQKAENEQYHMLLQQREERASASSVLSLLQSLAAKTGEADAVHIEHVQVEGSAVGVRGVVSGIGPRSMTVLASFIGYAEEDRHIQGIKTPAFSRLQTEAGEWYSPFTVSFTFLP